MSEHENHPDIAEEAMRVLRHAQPKPDPGRMALEQQAFLAQARRLRQTQPVSGYPIARHKKWTLQLLSKGWANMPGLVRALLILTLLSGLAAGTAAAADASLPGQPLSGVDALMEQTRLRLAGTPEQQAWVALHLAEERALELNRLADHGSPLLASQTLRLQAQLRETLRLSAQLDDPQMLQLLTRLLLMTQTQVRVMSQQGLMDGALIMNQVRTQAQTGLTDPGAFRAVIQTQQITQTQAEPNAGQPTEDPVVEDDESTVDDGSDVPGRNGQNTDPGDPDPGNDTPGTGQQGNSSPGGNEDAGTPGPQGNNTDPGDPAPGNDDAGNDRQGGEGLGGGGIDTGGSSSGEQGSGNK